MSFTYGFYDSVDEDRVYTAEQFSNIFDGIITDGVFNTCQIAGSVSNNDRFKVTHADGMRIYVGRGRAWFNNTWNYNDTVMGMTVPKPSGVLDRYDAVVLEVNKNDDRRVNSIKIISGTPNATPTKPKMVRSNGVFQYALAYILVRAGSTEIAASDIQNVVGTTETPYCRCLADDIGVKTKNDLVTTEAGYILDARQGKVLNDKITTLNNRNDELNRTANGLNQSISYIDSDISNLNGSISGLNSAISIENSRITALNNTVNGQTSQISSLNTSVNNNKTFIDTNLNASDGSNTIPFKFGVDSDGNYGYYKKSTSGGADTFCPFKKNDPMRFLKVGDSVNNPDGIIDMKTIGRVKTFYNKLTADNFFIKFKGLVTAGDGVSTRAEKYPEGSLIQSMANMDFGVESNPSVTYSQATGVLRVNQFKATGKNLSFKLYEGTQNSVVQSYVNYSGQFSFIGKYEVWCIYNKYLG